MKTINSTIARIALLLLILAAFSLPVSAQQTPVCVVINGACVSSTNPLPSGGTQQSYALLTNASSTGPATIVAGSNYLLSLSGTFGGASVAITSTTAGGTTTLATYTSAPASPVCFAIAAGTTIQATVTGGSPSGLYATLGGVGPGGCGIVGATGVVVNYTAQATVTETAVSMDGNWDLAWTAAAAKRIIIGFPSDCACSGDYTFRAALVGTTTSAGIPFAAGAGGSFDFSGGPPPNTSIYVKGTSGKTLTVQVFN